jgi:predicted DNA-binding transcriptional regulator AlpA
MTKPIEQTSPCKYGISAEKTPHPLVAADDVVLTLLECAKAVGLSLATLRRRIADGTGPRITRLSDRRLGVRIRHYKAWLDQQSGTAT